METQQNDLDKISFQFHQTFHTEANGIVHVGIGMDDENKELCLHVGFRSKKSMKSFFREQLPERIFQGTKVQGMVVGEIRPL